MRKTIPPPIRSVHSRTDFGNRNNTSPSVVPSTEYDTVIAETSRLSERLKELTENLSSMQKYKESDEQIYTMFDQRLREINEQIKTSSSVSLIEDKMKGIQDTIKLSLNPHRTNELIEDKMNNISADIKSILIAKQKNYEEQYNLLEKKYQKLKEAQEDQFFKFTNIISNYQMLIFKIISTSSQGIPQEEVQKLNELMRALTPSTNNNTTSNSFSYNSIPVTPIHTPHPSNVRRHHSAVGFKLNIPKRLNEEEILSESEYQQ